MNHPDIFGGIAEDSSPLLNNGSAGVNVGNFISADKPTITFH